MTTLFFLFWLTLWTGAAIIILVHPENESNRWVSACFFFGGFGGFTIFWKNAVIPYLLMNYIDNDQTHILGYVLGISSSLSHFFAPYAFLMFCICYSELFSQFWNKHKTLIAFILLIPPIAMYKFLPIYPDLIVDSPWPLFVWVTPYLLIGNLLLVIAYLEEEVPKIKHQRFLLCLLIVPWVTFSLTTNFILPVFNIYGKWRYDSLFVFLHLTLLFTFTSKYGLLGVKLKFEKHRLDNTVKALTSGTAIINHTLKNEIIKIRIFTNNIKELPCADNTEISTNVNNIHKSIDHMLTMLTKIHEQLQDIIINEVPCNLTHIIENSLDMVNSYILRKNITVLRKYNDEVTIICDAFHIQEILRNIFMNAIEAMKPDGILKIQIIRNEKNITIAVEDNGCGISKENMPYIFDPFFSTKKRTLNLGLGLSCCHNVMQKHGGSLEIKSKENNGTQVFLYFPQKQSHTLPKRRGYLWKRLKS